MRRREVARDGALLRTTPLALRKTPIRNPHSTIRNHPRRGLALQLASGKVSGIASGLTCSKVIGPGV